MTVILCDSVDFLARLHVLGQKDKLHRFFGAKPIVSECPPTYSCAAIIMAVVAVD
jgi:hypothetical protein